MRAAAVSRATPATCDKATSRAARSTPTIQLLYLQAWLPPRRVLESAGKHQKVSRWAETGRVSAHIGGLARIRRVSSAVGSWRASSSASDMADAPRPPGPAARPPPRASGCEARSSHRAGGQLYAREVPRARTALRSCRSLLRPGVHLGRPAGCWRGRCRRACHRTHSCTHKAPKPHARIHGTADITARPASCAQRARALRYSASFTRRINVHDWRTTDEAQAWHQHDRPRADTSDTEVPHSSASSVSLCDSIKVSITLCNSL